MIYKNDDLYGAAVMRKPEEPSEAKYCAVCGTEDPEEFFVSIQTDECVGCSECVNKYAWIDY